MHSIQIGKTALITTERWFVAPDGKQYRAVFGTVKAIHSDEEALGIRTNRGSTNWYVEIGQMVVAGCQVFYAIRADSFNPHRVEVVSEDGRQVSLIFNADEA